MVSAPGSCYLSPECQGLRTFPGVVATGGGVRRKITSGKVLVKPRLSRLLEKEARRSDTMKGLELAWLVWVEEVRRLPTLLPAKLLGEDEATTRY